MSYSFPVFEKTSTMKLLWNVLISNKTSDNSKVAYKEQWKRFQLMEIKKLNYN